MIYLAAWVIFVWIGGIHATAGELIGTSIILFGLIISDTIKGLSDDGS